MTVLQNLGPQVVAIGEGNGNPLQYSCLENPMDRRVWWATVHRVTKSQTQLKQLTMHNYHQSLPRCGRAEAKKVDSVLEHGRIVS